MDNFRLKKVKLLNELGVEVTYLQKITKGQETYWDEHTIKSAIQRHPDLDNAVECLKIHVARIYGLLAIGMYKSEKDMTKKEKELLETTLDCLKISGVILTGSVDEETSGILVTSQRKIFENKATVVMNTPNIQFDNPIYDYANDLKSIALDVQNEVYQYLFKGKYAMLDLFTNGDSDDVIGEANVEQTDMSVVEG